MGMRVEDWEKGDLKEKSKNLFREAEITMINHVMA